VEFYFLSSVAGHHVFFATDRFRLGGAHLGELNSWTRMQRSTSSSKGVISTDTGYPRPEKSEPQEISKEVAGIHVLLTRSLFGDGIPRRSLLRVSLAKPTSAPLRF
jgi:hypothetical protein